MKVFIEGNSQYRRAYFGWQDEDTALIGIKMGYKSSADELVDSALVHGEDGNIRVLDTYIFPIVFLYRHSIEISIKSVYYRCCSKVLSGGHNLLMLWDKLNKEVISTFDQQEFIDQVKKYKDNYRKHVLNDNELANVRSMLAEFSRINDEKADVFRYLIDKKGELYFTDSKFVDYDNLKTAMDFLYDYLEFLYFVTDDYLSS